LNRGAFLLLLVFPLLVPAAAISQGKGHGVEVLALSPKLVDAEPGGILTLSFRVTSSADSAEELLESLKLPIGWQAVIPQPSFILQPSESQLRIVALAVPRDASAGRYEIAYSVRGQRDYAVQDSDSVTVVLPTVGSLALLVEEKPQAVVAGEECQAKLRLINLGNSRLKVRLHVRSDDKNPATITPEEIDLLPGQGEAVIVTLKADPGETRLRQQTMMVKAETEGTPDGMPTAGATITVEIIPRAGKKVDLHHRLPGELSLRTIGDGDDLGFQAEVAASGTLDEAGMSRLDLLLRAPDLQQVGVLGERDEQRINYSSPRLDVNLGDQSYGLSRLTDYYRYGKGLEIRAHDPQGQPEFGAYYVKSRWIHPASEQSALYLGTRLSDRLKLRFNLLRKRRPDSTDLSGFDDSLYSLECAFNPTDQTNVHLEYGRSRTSRDGGAHDSAYLFEWNGAIADRAHYSFSRVRAGPDYYGYYFDSDYTQGSFVLPLGDRVQARASYQRWEENLDMLPERGPAPLEVMRSAGLRYELAGDWYASLDYDDLDYRDLLLPAQYDARERLLKVGIGRSSPTYSFRAEFQDGTGDDLLAGETHHVRNCALYLSYRSTPRLSFTLYGQLGKSDREAGRLLGGTNNIGASVRWRPNDNILVSFYYLRYVLGLTQSDFDQALLLLSYSLPDGTSWAFRARRSNRPLGGQSEYCYELSYTVPFGLAVSRLQSIGGIEGKVFLAADPKRAGLPDVILTANGSAAVTDHNGRFTFPALSPGTYFLDVRPESLGLDRVADQELPIKVEVTGGEMSNLEIGVADAARLSGTLTLAPPSIEGDQKSDTIKETSGVYLVGDPMGGGTTNEERGLANVLLELTCGDEVQRRITDRRGQFVFDRLRPGKWLLSVCEDNLPAYYHVENPKMEFTLGAGVSQEVSIEVVPRLRRIKMIEGD
jgi:hypothetical protein